MPSFRHVALLLLLVLTLGVGAGLARAGVVEVEGDMRVHIMPVPNCVMYGGVVGGPVTTGPFKANEPAIMQFSAYGVNDPNGGTVTVDWDFSFDTIQFNVEATGTGPVLHTYPDGPVDTLVAARLTASNGQVGYEIQRVIISNVPPTATLDGPYAGQPGHPVTFNGAATDPASEDVAAGIHFAWDFDYSTNVFTTDASGFNLTTVSHTYATPGNYTVALRVTDKDGGSTLVTAPVAISYDTTTVNLSALADTYLSQDTATGNYATSTLAYVKADDAGHARRTLVKFDTTSLPATALIFSAKVSLYAETVPGAERTHGAFLALAPWSEATATWTSTPSVSAAATTNGYTPATPGWVTWDVTADVQAFVNGTIGNQGWLIKDMNEGIGSGVTTAYDTKEASDSSKHPILTVEYAIP